KKTAAITTKKVLYNEKTKPHIIEEKEIQRQIQNNESNTYHAFSLKTGYSLKLLTEDKKNICYLVKDSNYDWICSSDYNFLWSTTHFFGDFFALYSLKQDQKIIETLRGAFINSGLFETKNYLINYAVSIFKSFYNSESEEKPDKKQDEISASDFIDKYWGAILKDILGDVALQASLLAISSAPIAAPALLSTAGIAMLSSFGAYYSQYTENTEAQNDNTKRDDALKSTASIAFFIAMLGSNIHRGNTMTNTIAKLFTAFDMSISFHRLLPGKMIYDAYESVSKSVSKSASQYYKSTTEVIDSLYNSGSQYYQFISESVTGYFSELL
ncbi:MAG: hypothetical protein O3C05_01095, partial [Proteobacteria bacterium]|nr:hypothetical protein [Pseudomonadota bacterium]